MEYTKISYTIFTIKYETLVKELDAEGLLENFTNALEELHEWCASEAGQYGAGLVVSSAGFGSSAAAFAYSGAILGALGIRVGLVGMYLLARGAHYEILRKSLFGVIREM